MRYFTLLLAATVAACCFPATARADVALSIVATVTNGSQRVVQTVLTLHEGEKSVVLLPCPAAIEPDTSRPCSVVITLGVEGRPVPCGTNKEAVLVYEIGTSSGPNSTTPAGDGHTVSGNGPIGAQPFGATFGPLTLTLQQAP